MKDYNYVKEYYKNHSTGLWADRYEKMTIYPKALFHERNNKIFTYLKSDREISKKRVLDFGCGHGDVSLLISPIAESVVAADIINSAPKVLEKYPANNITFVLIEDKIPFEDEEFDYIILPDVYEHFDPADRKMYLDEFRRILKPDGKLIIITPSKDAIIFLEKMDDLLLSVFGKKQVEIMANRMNFFVSKKELFNQLENSQFKVKSYKKICFYPAPERGGFYSLIEKVFKMIGLKKFFYYTNLGLVNVLKRFEKLNQKMFVIAEKSSS